MYSRRPSRRAYRRIRVELSTCRAPLLDSDIPLMLIRELAQLVHDGPHFGDISLEEMLAFMRLVQLVKPAIELSQRDRLQPPPRLPERVHSFLAAALRKSYTEVAWYWCAFRRIAWNGHPASATREDIAAFHEHGLSRGLGMYPRQLLYHLYHPYDDVPGYRDLYPPTRVCLHPSCKNFRQSSDTLTLTEPISYRATLFTLREGALPIHTTSLYCHCEYCTMFRSLNALLTA